MSSAEHHLREPLGPQDAANLADEFPSPTREPVTLSTQLGATHHLGGQAGRNTSVADRTHPSFTQQPSATSQHATTSFSPRAPAPHTLAISVPPTNGQSLTPAQQIAILREAYARNPNPDKKELGVLAEKTGRPWNKIREYFRQRRNKLRGLDDLEQMEEPGRASGWLQVTYRAAPTSSLVPQLNLYDSYKSRFDPYTASAPLLGGQDLIQLVCATFPGCEMAKDDGDYVMKGLKERLDANERDPWERGVEGMVEPLRAGTWLLSHYQNPLDPSPSTDVAQTELYASYAARFSSLLPEASSGATSPAPLSFSGQHDVTDLKETNDLHEAIGRDDLNSLSVALLGEIGPDENTGPSGQNRLLDPVELITLTRMTFPECEAAIDTSGRFVIKGLERREAVEKGRGSIRVNDMFPFALMSESDGTSPSHPLTSLLKRKFAQLNPEPGERSTSKKSRPAEAVSNGSLDDLPKEDVELLEGLKRFKGSRLGQEIKDICVTQ